MLSVYSCITRLQPTKELLVLCGKPMKIQYRNTKTKTKTETEPRKNVSYIKNGEGGSNDAK